MNQQNKRYILNIKSKSWTKDHHFLYDYESNHTQNKDFNICTTSYITRDQENIKINYFDNGEEEFLFKAKYNNNEFTLENEIPQLILPTEENINKISSKMWYILKSDPIRSNQSVQNINNTNDDYYLCNNDIIKFGRVKLLINEINIPSRQNNIDFSLENNDTKKYDIDNLNKNTQPVFDFIYRAKDASEFNDIPDDEKICKICYNEENNRENNPLVNLCHCNGGIRFGHFLCIKRWMKTKEFYKENSQKTVKCYGFMNFNCEICKTPYPFKFKINGIEKNFELVDIKKPIGSDYIVLESLNQIKNKSNCKYIHVIKLTGDELIIGRSKESDITINDISVSRNHALLKYNINDGSLLIRDLKSKFGTLILIKKPLKIKEKEIHLQVGRTYIEANIVNSNKPILFKVHHMETKVEVDDINNKNNKMEIEEEYEEQNMQKKINFECLNNI